jgi:hypothetical protein
MKTRRKTPPAPIWYARWCGGLAASSSHHHLYHVYMVKTRFAFEGGDVDLKKA